MIILISNRCGTMDGHPKPTSDELVDSGMVRPPIVHFDDRIDVHEDPIVEDKDADVLPEPLGEP